MSNISHIVFKEFWEPRNQVTEIRYEENSEIHFIYACEKSFMTEPYFVTLAVTFFPVVCSFLLFNWGSIP